MSIWLKLRTLPSIYGYARARTCIKLTTQSILIFILISPLFEFPQVNIKIFNCQLLELLCFVTTLFLYCLREYFTYYSNKICDCLFIYLQFSFAVLFQGGFSSFCSSSVMLWTLPLSVWNFSNSFISWPI